MQREPFRLWQHEVHNHILKQIPLLCVRCLATKVIFRIVQMEDGAYIIDGAMIDSSVTITGYAQGGTI
jgi:hypothetical protein